MLSCYRSEGKISGRIRIDSGQALNMRTGGTEYEEIYGYGTKGIEIFAGLKAKI